MERIKLLKDHWYNININKNITNRIIWLFLVFFSITKINAQSITEDAIAMDKNIIQLETGLIYEYQNNTATWTFPSILLRYGLNNNIEFRLGTAIESRKHIHWLGEGSFKEVEAGFKLHLIKSRSTNLSFITHLIFPTKISQWDNKSISSTAVLVFSQDLGDHLQIGSSLQYLFKNNTNNDLNYSIIMNYFINAKWDVYLETYGDIIDDTLISNVDFGFAYHMSPKFQWQLSAGTNLKHLDYHFMSTGFVWQIN